MWVSKNEYDKLKEKASQYDGLMRSMNLSGVTRFSGFYVLSDMELDKMTHMSEHTALEEQIKDLKEERDAWASQCKQKEVDVEFYKSLYIDMRKLYEELCIAKK